MSLVTADLNERQSAFVDAILSGRAPSDAAADAGYSTIPTAVYQLLRSPTVLGAIHAGVQRKLQHEAALSLGVLVKIRDDKDAPARVRADIGVKLMTMAGHAPQRKSGHDDKPLSQMTQSEMIEFIERNQASVEAAERELAARAKDITPHAGVTVSVPTPGAATAKPLNYLD